jgi:hypothetical protein
MHAERSRQPYKLLATQNQICGILDFFSDSIRTEAEAKTCLCYTPGRERQIIDGKGTV